MRATRKFVEKIVRSVMARGFMICEKSVAYICRRDEREFIAFGGYCGLEYDRIDYLSVPETDEVYYVATRQGLQSCVVNEKVGKWYQQIKQPCFYRGHVLYTALTEENRWELVWGTDVIALHEKEIMHARFADGRPLYRQVPINLDT